MATMGFKKLEVNGYTKEEALSKAPFQIMRDATQAWKAAGKPMMDKELNAFCSEYLAKHTKFIANAGCVITFEAGSADTRERPYTVSDIKNEKGKRKYQTGILGLNPATGEQLFLIYGSKAEAKEAAKKLYTEKGYKGDIHATYVKQVAEGEPGAFDVTYTPSKSAKVGKYIVFGVEA